MLSLAVPWLSAKYGIDEFKKFIQKCCAESQRPAITNRLRRQTSYLHGHNESYSHTTSFKSRNGVARKTSVCTDSSTTLTAAWSVNSKTMALAILQDASQAGAPSMVCSVMNLDAEMRRWNIFTLISIRFTASWWSCLEISWRRYIASVHSTSSYQPIIGIDDVGSHSIHISITSCSHWRIFEQWPLHCCAC